MSNTIIWGIKMEFKEQLKEYQKIVENQLEKYIRKDKCPEEVLNQSMEYSLMAGGKRLRPILALSTYKLFKEDYEECMPFAVAIEMIHNFSLIHDDLPEIDNDDFRHGKPTNHKKFNQATAVLAGDGLLNQAYMVISEEISKSTKKQDNIHSKIRAFNELTNAIDRVIAGEFVDTEAEGKKISKEILQYIHKNKTGEFLKAAARIGAIIAAAPEEDIERLTKYADNIGLAFQIKDDILSEEGDPKITGKPVENDKETGKCTYVAFYGLDGAKEQLKNIIDDAIKEIEIYGEKAEFLKQLALFIRDRNK